MSNTKILIVSDSLGTPIHARGIFNYTSSFVQILKNLGADVHLLVEPPTVGLSTQSKQSDFYENVSAGTKRAIISDLIRHYHGDRFRFEWNYSDPSTQRFVTEFKNNANVMLALGDTDRVRRQLEVVIPEDEWDEFTLDQYSEHLRLFSGFILSDSIYKESFRRGYQNLRPVVVDAAGYDSVLVDTPHYIQFVGIDPQNIAYVIHDFIPLYESVMGFDWRQLFARKLECTLKEGRIAIFNSETTGNYFRKIFGNNACDTEIVIYPPIRADVAAAAKLGRKGKSDYIEGIAQNKLVEQRQWHTSLSAGLADSETPNLPIWNGKLPFFCSILSDEPRKNISAIVKASKDFVGRANFVVMGQINGNAYTDERPEDFPNLHFTGYVSDIQKFDLLRACTGFIFPSLLEGFGIPIIEAAILGAPVICTNTEVFREITFGMAKYFDPGDNAALVKHIDSILNDKNRETSISTLQSAAAAAFSQSTMAERLRETRNGLISGDRDDSAF